jgi:hypothetical protein
MTSQRVLSGSKTKGSSASLTGSVQYFYQGTSVRTFSSFVGSLLPRIGVGDRIELYKDGSPLDTFNEFDDSIVINNNSADMGGDNDGKRLEERISHYYEDREFGQPTMTLKGEPYADTIKFDPVVYINDSQEVMWPVNMWNAGSLDDHEFDGVIEPLDIRREVFGEIVTRYEGHAIRGALVGAASEQPWGSKEIDDVWYLSDKSNKPFLDAPVTFSLESDETPLANQAYQDIEQSPDTHFLEENDYHDRVYFSVTMHNNSDMRTALRQLNSSSCNSLTDPFEKRANKGLVEGQNVGSLAFSNLLVVGEQI